MATIDQNGNAFGTSMNIGTTDLQDVNIMTNGTNKVTIEKSSGKVSMVNDASVLGQMGVGVSTPTTFNASAVLFPSLMPKVEILTGAATNVDYNEGLVLRHKASGTDIKNRNIGIIFKLSHETTAAESTKAGAIMMGSTNAFANAPTMNFYLGHDANPKMQILYSGNIKVSSLAGSGSRMVTADSTGTLSATTEVTSGTYTPTITGIYTYIPRGFKYTRTGNIVHVSGGIEVTSTYIGPSSFNISLPPGISSTFTDEYDVTGVVSGLFLSAEACYVLADYPNGEAVTVYAATQPNPIVFVQFDFIVQ